VIGWIEGLGKKARTHRVADALFDEGYLLGTEAGGYR
jgi:hypothetical protein